MINEEEKKPSFKLPKIPNWFWDGTESVFWNILGNLIPIWFVAAISIYEYGLDMAKIYDAIHQPYTYLILSATYLTTTFYILNRKGGFYKHKYFAIIFIVLLMIIGYTIKDRKALEDSSATFNKEIFIVIVFLLSFMSYVFYEFKTHFDVEKTSSEEESKKQFKDLKDSFKNFKENE